MQNLFLHIIEYTILSTFSKMLLLAAFLFTFPNFSKALTLPKIVKDGMVLQSAPYEARIWGYHDGYATAIALTIVCQEYANTLVDGNFTTDTFEFRLEVPHGEVCNLTFWQYHVTVS